MVSNKSPMIAVVGLGYVGLPVCMAFHRVYPSTRGFDINSQRVDELRDGVDRSGNVSRERLQESDAFFTSDPGDIRDANVYVVAVPTPIDDNHRPDLSMLRHATSLVGELLAVGDLVIYESTVYPGLTEGLCADLLSEISGLKSGSDFAVGYSPERINPGDPAHIFESVVKVVAGSDAATLDRVATLYGSVVDAGVYRASSIKVAEMAKLIENTQRDLNVALANEVALICDRLGIQSRDVFETAETKWNFTPFRPGLVGGHCIGVDPYYLTARAEEVGYHPELLLAGRRINDSMGRYIAQRVVKLMTGAGLEISGARVGVLGLTFKENVSDVRNSRVPELVEELAAFGVESMVHDPLADPRTTREQWGVPLLPREDLKALDGLVLAVKHRAFLEMDIEELIRGLRPGGVLVDVKACLDPREIPANVIYWCL